MRTELNASFYFGGTSLIVVIVVMDSSPRSRPT